MKFKVGDLVRERKDRDQGTFDYIYSSGGAQSYIGAIGIVVEADLHVLYTSLLDRGPKVKVYWLHRRRYEVCHESCVYSVERQSEV
mgnify:CR=1 FL=1